MPTYKIYYFNSRGFAELARWVFAEGGQEYEDVRWELDEWPQWKPSKNDLTRAQIIQVLTSSAISPKLL